MWEAGVPGPLSGIKVIEMSSWAALPGAGAVLSDWGAEVIKIEEPSGGGDPTRAFSLTTTASGSAQVAPVWEQNNRNKKSVTIDARRPEGQEAVRRLVAGADVFVTSTRPKSLERLGLDYARLKQVNRRLIYLHLSGYGPKGEDSDRPGFDMLCFWARTGIARSLAEPGGAPINQRPAMGDHATSLVMAGAISAALYHRERTGVGQAIQTSLLHTGLWVNSVDVFSALASGQDAASLSRWMVSNPLVNSYQTADGWVQLTNLQSDRHWAPFCRAMGRPELIDDPSFSTMERRAENGVALVQIFADEFAKRSTAEWAPDLDAEDIRWGPIQTVLEASQDPQAVINGYFASVDHVDAGPLDLVTSPAQFEEPGPGVHAPAPQLGQHTEEVLLEAGYTWEELESLKAAGVIL